MTSGGRVTPCCDPPTGPDVVYWAACDAIFFSSSSFQLLETRTDRARFPADAKGRELQLARSRAKCRSFARSLRESGSISLGGVCGCRLLVGPSHHLAGGVKKYEVADFAECAKLILADVLGYPKGNFAVLAHEAQQIALPQEVDLGRLLGLGCGFILAPRNYSGDS